MMVIYTGKYTVVNTPRDLAEHATVDIMTQQYEIRSVIQINRSTRVLLPDTLAVSTDVMNR